MILRVKDVGSDFGDLAPSRLTCIVWPDLWLIRVPLDSLMVRLKPISRRGLILTRSSLRSLSWHTNASSVPILALSLDCAVSPLPNMMVVSYPRETGRLLSLTVDSRKIIASAPLSKRADIAPLGA